MELRMKERTYGRMAVIAFFLIVIPVSAVFEMGICDGGPDWLYLALMWTPAVAALAASCVSIRERGERITIPKLFAVEGFHRCALRYVLLGCLLPLVYLLIPYAVYWMLYPENFAYHGVSVWLVLKDIALPMVIGIFVSLLSAAGEEIGWRGFMVPALYERLGLNRALAISSLFWCCWHLPLLIGGDYMPGTPLWYQLPAFVLCIFPVGVMAGILAIRCGSMWPAAFLHAAHNNYDQAIFGLLTRGDHRMYFVSETGILTIICAWTLAIIMYRSEKKRLEGAK